MIRITASRNWIVRLAATACAVAAVSAGRADEERPGAYQRMDYGPVIADTISADRPEENLARKGLGVRLEHDATMVFDTDLLRYSAAAVGGWLDLTTTDRTSYRGRRTPSVEGRQVFGTKPQAGWASEGRFDGPREDGMGNLPHDWAHYKGYYRYGDRVLLKYTVGETTVYEQPQSVVFGGEAPAFLRRFEVGPSTEPMRAYLLQQPENSTEVLGDGGLIVLAGNTRPLAVALLDAPEAVSLDLTDEGEVVLDLPADEGVRTFSVAFFEQDATGIAAAEEIRDRLAGGLEPVGFDRMREGGPARWEEELPVETEFGDESGGYVIDRIGVPEENPWQAWIRPSGFAFFDCGTRAAIGTWNGDVWVVSGLGGDLEDVRWKRFASGLYGAMGLVVDGEDIFVTEYSQLTRLRDLNGNGEADFYESFNNDGLVFPRAHSLTLERDSEGYFYFFKNGNRVPEGVPQHGALIRVSPDGGEREVFASGIRGANTLGIGPDDLILSADQQGNWVPVERIDRLRQGGFYGYRPHGGQDVSLGEFELPVCWIPYRLNNSSGPIQYVGDDRWGPMSGNWILGSYGRQTVFAVLTEEIGGTMQGGVVRFPMEFGSGLVRADVNPRDGQLYLAGMRGWGTRAREDASLERVRYSGEPVYLPHALNVTPEGVRLTFSQPLDRASAEDPENYDVRRWGYLYTEEYGSPEMSVANPGEQGRDPVAVGSVSLSEDGKTVFVEIPDIEPVMQQMIRYELRFADGHSEENAVYHTIHVLSEEDEPRNLAQLDTEMTEEVVSWLDPEADPDDRPVWFVQGRESFEMNCQACHQSGGVAPAMVDSRWAGESPEVVGRILLQGMEGRRGLMTSFDWMDDDELAAVLSYIRARWFGKNPIEPDTIARLREETADRDDFWTPEELRDFMDE